MAAPPRRAPGCRTVHFRAERSPATSSWPVAHHLDGWLVRVPLLGHTQSAGRGRWSSGEQIDQGRETPARASLGPAAIPQVFASPWGQRRRSEPWGPGRLHPAPACGGSPGYFDCTWRARPRQHRDSDIHNSCRPTWSCGSLPPPPSFTVPADLPGALSSVILSPP